MSNYFEYKKYRFIPWDESSPIQSLNKFGKDGWDVFLSIPNQNGEIDFYLKRTIDFQVTLQSIFEFPND